MLKYKILFSVFPHGVYNMTNKQLIDVDDLFSIEKVLAIIGALLVILSVYLTWSSVDFTDEDGDVLDESWKGSEINDMMGNDNITSAVNNPYYAYPIPTMVLGIFCLFAAVINRNFMGSIYIPMALVTFAVLALLFAGMNYGNVAGNNVRITDYMEEIGTEGEATNGIGLLMGLVGALVAFIGAVVMFAKLLKEGEGDVRDLLHIHYEKKPRAHLDDDIAEGMFITSQTAKRYHRSKCPYAVNIPASGGILVNKEEAAELGKVPCECLDMCANDD